MRTLVLGGSSFVGGRLVRHLLDEGHDVSVMNRGRSGAPVEGVTQLTADRRDAESMRAALGATQWDAVFDVSGYVMATDAQNFTALLDMVAGRVRRYVFVSSVMAYQPSGFFPWYEDAPDRDEPPTTYGGFKVFAERALMQRQGSGAFEATVARPAAIYGPANNIYDMEAAMFLRLRRGLPILLPHGGLVATSYGHVDELAAALLVLANSAAAPGEIFNITGVGVTAEQYVRTLADIVGAIPDIRWIPDDMLAALDRPAFGRLFRARHHGVISVEKAQTRLGLPAERGFRAGHEDTYAWFLSSPLALAETNLDDPLWGKGFDFAYEAEIADRLKSSVQ